MKKILCVILSILFVISAVPFSAYADDKDNADVTPVVVVPGIGSSGLYLNPNTADQQNLSFDIGGIVKTAIKSHIVSRTLKFVRGRSIEPKDWIESVSAVSKHFEFLGCDSDGNSLENIGIDCYWEDSLANHMDYLDSRATAEPAVCKVICDEIGAENVWIFNYDARLDVIKHSDKLSEFIDGVKKQSGSDKVALVSCSLGTCVVSSYIDRYKDKNDIARSVFLDGAFQGVAVAKAFAKDLVIDKQIVYDYLTASDDNSKMKNVDYGKILEIFLKLDGTVDNAVNFLQKLTSGDNLDSFYLDVVLPIIGNMPALWECIAYDDFDNAVVAMSEIGWLKEDSGLYKTINEYHQIQGRLENNLKELRKNGVEIAIVCGYGLPSMPVTSLHNSQSDMLIDTQYASFGAAVSPLDNIAPNATSADGYINTSSCKFKNNTWFLKGVQHMEFQYGTDVGDFIGYICTTDKPLNIKSVDKDKNYKQFMQIDDDYNMTNV